MKPLNWVELTRQQIKARHGFGWSIQGIEKQNKVLTKIVYRFSTGGRTTVLTDIEWNTNNSKKIQDLIIEFETLMEERHVDLKKAYELIVGKKVFTDKKNINWEVIVNEFVNEERGNRRETTKRDLRLRMKRTLQALNTKPVPRTGEQLFKNYADLFFNRVMPKGGVGRKRAIKNIWLSICAEAEAQAQECTPYSFRHRYAYVAHTRPTEKGLYRSPNQIANSMGHDLNTHTVSYARFEISDLEEVFDLVEV